MKEPTIAGVVLYGLFYIMYDTSNDRPALDFRILLTEAIISTKIEKHMINNCQTDKDRKGVL